MPIKETGFQQLKHPNTLPKEPYLFGRRRESEPESSGLAQVAGVLRRKAGVIASVAVIVTSLAAAWSLTRTPVYEGRFQLLVEPLETADSELLKLLSKTLQQNVNELTKEQRTTLDYQALMEVLRSPKVVNPAITELQNKYPEISYAQLVGMSNNDPAKKQAKKQGTLDISRIAKGKDESRVIEVRYQESDTDKIEFVLDRVSQAYQKYSLEQQQTNLRQGIKFVEQQIPKLRLRVNALQGQMQIFQQRHRLFNPELQGEQLLRRADDMKSQRLETERRLAEAKSVYASLQSQLGMSQNAAIASSALSESPQYQQILSRVRDIEARIATESVRFNEQSPIIQSLREQRDKLVPLLNREAQLALGSNIPTENVNTPVGVYQNTVRRQLIQQMAEVSNQIQLLEASYRATYNIALQLDNQLKQYPALARQYLNMQRELQVSTDTLNQLLSKQEALRVDAAQQEIPWELIMPPTIPRDKKGKFLPVSPVPARDILLGAIGGLLLGSLVAFLMENLQNVFQDPDEVKDAIRLPLLGVIPFHKDLNKLAWAADKENYKLVTNISTKFRQQKISDFLESFCSLYTRIQSLRAEIPIRSIAVTSPAPGDGKSTIAENLAQIAAQAGQRVLLVDADLRHPQLHLRLGLSNTQGLTEVLTEGLDPNEVVKQSSVDDNLFVLTSGKVPRNPTKLFSSARIQDFVERSHASFDLVIYDTPYLLGILDTNLLAAHVDGVVCVVGLGKTMRPSMKKALDELKASRASVLGVIANAVER